jgi:hypothetical protein
MDDNRRRDDRGRGDDRDFHAGGGRNLDFGREDFRSKRHGPLQAGLAAGAAQECHNCNQGAAVRQVHDTMYANLFADHKLLVTAGSVPFLAGTSLPGAVLDSHSFAALDEAFDCHNRRQRHCLRATPARQR